jgi:tetratricopeptide (TPR) repeat protein
MARSWDNPGKDERAGRWDEAIARALYPIINRKDSTDRKDAGSDAGFRNDDAREAILAARELMSRYALPDLDRAVALLEKAIRIEPGSGLAHAYLSNVLSARAHYNSDGNSLVVAESEARKAVALSPTSADAHRALAAVLYQQGQYPLALEQLLSTAETLGTDDKSERFIGMALDTLGLTERAFPWFDRARRSTKRPGDVDAAIGDGWVKLGADERAMKAYQRAIELQPGIRRAQIGIAQLRLRQGDFAAARRENKSAQSSDELGEGTRMEAQIAFFARNFEMAIKLYSSLSGGEFNGGGSFYGALDYQSALGRSFQAVGRSVEAEDILSRCLYTERRAVETQRGNPEALYRLAAVESSLGLIESSLQHLRSALECGWLDYRSLQLDPRFDSLRSDLQFEAMVSNLSLKVAEKRKRAEALSGPQ